MVLCERWRLVGPPASALRGLALNHPVVRWLKTVVLSDRGKAWLDCVRWGPGRRSRSARLGRSGWASSLRRRNCERWHQNRGSFTYPRDELGGCPCSWPGGVRRRGGVSPVCGSCAEREKASVDMASGVVDPKGRVRERANGGNRRH